VEKGNPKFWATSVVFKKLPKVNKRQYVGENSPNLVTLPGRQFSPELRLQTGFPAG
jgi:hypothetical protein